MNQELRKFPYGEKPKKVNLHFLERRKVRGDIFEVFKWVKYINKSYKDEALIMKTNVRTCGNEYKLD